MSDPARSFLVTGTWGVGKTHILDLLGTEFSVVEEPGRRVARAAGEFDPEQFTQFVGTITRAAHLRALEDGGVFVFDRGVVDCLAYARWFGLDEEPFRRYVSQLRYHEDVFFFPLWPEIYATDAERKATLEMATAFETVLLEVLGESRYNLVDVPRRDPSERAAFLRNELRSRI